MTDSVVAPETSDMAVWLELYPAPRRLALRSIVQGTVVQEGERGFFVDIGQKSESIVLDAEELTVGETYPFLVLSEEPDDDGSIAVSYQGASGWVRVCELAETGEIVSATVRSVSKNKKTGKEAGLNVFVEGMKGFLPASQLYRGDSMEDFVGAVIPVIVKTASPQGGRHGTLILSHKRAAEVLRKEAVAGITEGEIRSGVVKKVLDIGALVEIADHTIGLVYKTEISKAPFSNPKDLLRKGQEVTVKVISVDREEGKISLSIRQVAADALVAGLAEGDIVRGAISNSQPYGVFATLDGVLDGLMHFSKRLSGEELVQGQTYAFRVITIDRERGRVSLSRQDLPEHLR